MYLRRSRKLMSESGFALFVSDEKRGLEATFDFLEGSGPNAWAYDGTGNIVNANDNELISLCIMAWKNEDSRPVIFKKDEFEDEEWERMLNPEDIVNSAEIYGNLDLHEWLWANVLEAIWPDAIITNDGAVVYNESLCRPFDCDEDEDEDEDED